MSDADDWGKKPWRQTAAGVFAARAKCLTAEAACRDTGLAGGLRGQPETWALALGPSEPRITSKAKAAMVAHARAKGTQSELS